jgi:hypothetical protein
LLQTCAAVLPGGGELSEPIQCKEGRYCVASGEPSEVLHVSFSQCGCEPQLQNLPEKGVVELTLEMRDVVPELANTLEVQGSVRRRAASVYAFPQGSDGDGAFDVGVCFVVDQLKVLEAVAVDALRLA